MRRAPSLAILLLMSACGPEPVESVSQDSEPLLRGRTCEAHEHPGAVPFTATTNGQTRELCSGTLIAPDVVLTAAHCNIASGAQVYFHDVDKTILVKEGVSNPSFHVDQTGDIALAFLAEVAPVQPEVLISADEAHLLQVGMPVSIEGFGSSTAPNAGIGIEKCGSAVLTQVGKTALRIDPDSTLTNACYGDSGGPTFITVEGQSAHSTRVVGVNSFLGPNSGGCAGPWGVTRVDAYLDWIQQTLSNGCLNGVRAWCDTTGLPPQCLTLESTSPKPKFVDSCAAPKSKCGSESTGLPALLALLVLVRRRFEGVRRLTRRPEPQSR